MLIYGHMKTPKIRILKFAVFFLTIGFVGGLFWPLFHINELRGISNRLQSRAENIDRVMDAVKNGVFTPATISLLKGIGERATNALVEILQDKSSSSLERQRAAAALGLIGDPSAIPHLSKLLTDRDSEVRLSAIEAMNEIGGGEAAVAFIKALENALEKMPQSSLSGVPQREKDWWHYYSRIKKLGFSSISEFQKAFGLRPNGTICARTRRAVEKACKDKGVEKK